MAWTSSTAIINNGTTNGNNSLILGDWSGDYLEIYGAGNAVLAGGGNDSVGAIMYSALGMNGNYAYIDGGAGNDIVGALALQGNQYATLVGGAGYDVLIGGLGADNFWYGAGEGNDFITNADWLDTVTLYNRGLRNIGAVHAEAGTIVVAQDADKKIFSGACQARQAPLYFR